MNRAPPVWPNETLHSQADGQENPPTAPPRGCRRIDSGNVICPDSILCTICRAVSIARTNLCPEGPVEAHRLPTSEDPGYWEAGTWVGSRRVSDRNIRKLSS